MKMTDEVIEAVKKDIEECKIMARVAFDLETRAAAIAKWRSLCDTLHTFGLSVAQIEAV